MSAISDYFKNLWNVKKNWNKVKANPFSAVVFEYKAYRIIVGLMAIFIIFQLGYLIFTLTGNSKPMLMVSRGFILLIMCIICFKLYGFVKQKKKIMDDYLANPIKIDNIPAEKKLDVGVEVDEILARFDDKGKLKEKKNGKS